MRVVCAGHVNWDVTLFVDALPAPDAEARIGDRREGGGGSAANVAVALSRLGVTSGLVGAVADDRDGRNARRELREAGVDARGVRVVEGGMTAVKYLVVTPDGETCVLGTEGVNEAFSTGTVPPDYFERAEHLHLTGQDPATAAALAVRAREMGLGVSFDPGRRLAGRADDEVLALADVVFLNEREAEAIRERVPPGRVVVTKRGAGGATAETPAGRIDHPGYDVEAVDSTGAGDAFAAGFLAAILDGDGYERALAVANAFGALVAGAPGTRPPFDPADVADRCGPA
ncbi:carbohydrate kinase family protein [Halomarina halobia]|uniref:Carbohydrate kinase family protein n=1 Tax=Halomarina halobia TaxID=3033386 RepID=A0ABD6A7Q7_9EURY|nr:carbohydrate kinase family protein [Halomarina sp. PSR21]